MKTRIKELRLSKKMTQRALGNIINCSQNYISQIELEQNLPRADILLAIANHFNVSVDYLLCRTDYKNSIEIDTSHETKQTLEYAKKITKLSCEKRQVINNIIDIFLKPNE
ncbi:hypothetical protein C817_02131 [Dorea sp. 5-2]|nr:hypothetical protein C817_02131 [Dorea sp. 5-2]